MPAGFQVFNDAGQLQVDQEAFTHYFLSKSTGTSVTADVGRSVPSMFTVSVASSVAKPLVAISCASAVALYGRKVVGSNVVFKYLCQGSTGTSFTSYVFQSCEALAASSFGLDVYNSSGQVVFSAGQKPMRLLGALTTSTATLEATGRTIAVGLASWSGYRNEDATDFWYYNGVLSVPNDTPPNEPGWEMKTDYTAKLYGGYVSGSTAYAADVNWDSARIAVMDGFGSAIGTVPNPFATGYKPQLVVDVTGY